MELTLRVMEPAGAGPAVRAAVDRLVAVRCRTRCKLAGDEIERFGPLDLDELVGAARASGPGPFSSQPLRTAGRVTRAL